MTDQTTAAKAVEALPYTGYFDRNYVQRQPIRYECMNPAEHSLWHLTSQEIHEEIQSGAPYWKGWESRAVYAPRSPEARGVRL